MNFGKVRFTRKEIDSAEEEMHRTKQPLSSIKRSSIAIGLTCNKTGTQYFCGYHKGFNLGLLNTYDGGETYIFDTIQIPPWLLDAIDTPFEAEARKVSLEWSVARNLDDGYFAMLDMEEPLSDLRRRIAEARRPPS